MSVRLGPSPQIESIYNSVDLGSSRGACNTLRISKTTSSVEDILEILKANTAYSESRSIVDDAIVIPSCSNSVGEVHTPPEPKQSNIEDLLRRLRESADTPVEEPEDVIARIKSKLAPPAPARKRDLEVLKEYVVIPPGRPKQLSVIQAHQDSMPPISVVNASCQSEIDDLSIFSSEPTVILQANDVPVSRPPGTVRRAYLDSSWREYIEAEVNRIRAELLSEIVSNR